MELVGYEDYDVGNSNSDIRSTSLQWCEVHLSKNPVDVNETFLIRVTVYDRNFFLVYSF